MPRTKGFDPDAAVDAAMQLFWANGYAGTTPQQLVDAMGIGRGSLYNTFESKHALFERALRRYHDTNTARLLEVLEGPGTAPARLRAALDMVIAAARTDERHRGCLITNTAVEFADRDEPVSEVVRRTFDLQEAAFRAVVEEGKRAGDIPADRDAAALAAFFLTTTNGIQVLAKVDPDLTRLSALADTAMRAL